MISIVVPAHNESSVIVRTLFNMTDGARIGELEVIVVCNGCTDNTAALARKFGESVRVVETEVASKAHALNLGDREASSFPRIYVDADVVFSLSAIRALADRLRLGDILLAAPAPHLELNGCSAPVRAFYEIRSCLPSAREGIGGSGVYGLSKAGRNRFNRFPNLVADDAYVRIQFTKEERETLASITSTVFAPRRIKDLIAIRTRVYYGNAELARLFPDLWKNRGENNHKILVQLLKRPALWIKVLVYICINITAFAKYKFYLNSGAFVWYRDGSSRSGG
jgi:glycosyltransferase involved in cell wall biosynthesis